MEILEYTTAIMELAGLQRISRQVALDLETVLDLYRADNNIFKTVASFIEAVKNQRKMTGLTRHFIGVIIKNKDQGKIPFICAHFWKLVCKKEFDILVNVTVTSAVLLAPAQRAAIRRRLVKRLGKDLAVKYVVDPQIIGGLVIQAGDLFMNYSVARELELLEREISRKKRYA